MVSFFVMEMVIPTVEMTFPILEMVFPIVGVETVFLIVGMERVEKVFLTVLVAGEGPKCSRSQVSGIPKCLRGEGVPKCLRGENVLSVFVGRAFPSVFVERAFLSVFMERAFPSVFVERRSQVVTTIPLMRFSSHVTLNKVCSDELIYINFVIITVYIS